MVKRKQTNKQKDRRGQDKLKSRGIKSRARKRARLAQV